jgi:hypothetical protein
MKVLGRVRQSHGTDAGVGVVTVIFVMAVVSALSITAASLTINNLGNASRDRQALAALATSEAGVAQAIAYLRTGNLGSLTCEISSDPSAAPPSSCSTSTNTWVNPTTPREVRLDGTAGACTAGLDCTKVWIGTLKKYAPGCPESRLTPPQRCTGSYRIHTLGFSGNGPSARRLAVDVEVAPYPYPIGIFTENFSGNGNVGVHRMSVFSNGCIKNRQRDDTSGSGFQFEWDAANNRPRLDVVYDQPASAHTTDIVSTSNNTCGDGSGGERIHKPGLPACNTQFKYDQTGLGASLAAGDGCHGAYTRTDASKYPTTSAFTPEELARYGYRPRGLTDSQYDALKSQAQAQGTYNIATGSVSTQLTALANAGIASPVLYWDSGDVSLNLSNIPAVFKRTINNDTTSCGTKSLTIVVSGPGNDFSFSNGNTSPYVVASMFVPDGTLTGQGGSNTIGTVFAKVLDVGGNVDFFMDRCFAANPPGATLDVEVTNWSEDDSKDVA